MKKLGILLAAVLLVGLVAPQPATANHCGPATINVQTGSAVSSGDPTRSQHRGVKADVRVTRASQACVRVSAVALYRLENDAQMEFGWVTGIGGVPICNGYFPYPLAGQPPNPIGFVARVDQDGVYKCWLTGDQFLSTASHTFSINNSDLDNTFHFYLNGVLTFTSSNAGMTIGAALTNGERHTYSDDCYARFDTVLRLTGSGWFDSWQTHWADNDSVCSNYITQGSAIPTDVVVRV